MEQQNKRGGARPNSGRPRKDPKVWGQITCVLRRDTIQRLKEGCGGASKHFGQFLQDHLDRYPLPSRELYLYRQKLKEIPWRPGDPARERQIRELRRKEREQERLDKKLAKMTAKERAAYKRLQKDIQRVATMSDEQFAKEYRTKAA